MNIYTPIELLKAIAAQIGETRGRKDGYDWKKISATKWIRLSKTRSPDRQKADAYRRANRRFDYAMTSPLGNILDAVMLKHGVQDMSGLTDLIEGGRRELAGEIYRDVIAETRKVDAPVGWKKDLTDNVGHFLILLRDTFSTASKVKLTVKKKGKGGKEYYRNIDEAKVKPDLPSLKPTAIRDAKKKTGNWNVTGNLTTGNVRQMLDNGTAKLIVGEVKDRKAWVLPKKAEDMEITYKGDSLMIRVKQVTKKDKRTRATAKVEIRIPYAFAKAFLLNQIKSVRTRNNFIFRMERSEGYRKFLEGATT